MTHWHDTQQWQQAEREADADLADGRYEDFDSIDAMVADLEAIAEGAVTTVCLTGFFSFHRPVDRRHNALSVGRCASLTERASEGVASHCAARATWRPLRETVTVETGERVDLERPNLD